MDIQQQIGFTYNLSFCAISYYQNNKRKEKMGALIPSTRAEGAKQQNMARDSCPRKNLLVLKGGSRRPPIFAVKEA